MDTAKNYWNQNNCYKIILDCEEKLIPFYERFGFKRKANSMQLYYI
jgi:glucosamine-phosphate N-acetyltransferase